MRHSRFHLRNRLAFATPAFPWLLAGQTIVWLATFAPLRAGTDGAARPVVSNRPYVLLTNDDGVDSPGIRAVALALAPFADVVVVAPHVNRSGSSQSLVLREPIRVRRLETYSGATGVDSKSLVVYAASATPASCVHLALDHLAERRPDLVVSGINAGENIGSDTLMSGTVGAARMAQVLGFPAVAFSLAHRSEDYSGAAREAARLVKELLEKESSLGSRYLLNVNFPRGEAAGWKKPRLARLGARGYTVTFRRSPPREVDGSSPDLVFTPTVSLYAGERPEESDAWLLEHGHPTVTPLPMSAWSTEAARLVGGLSFVK